MRRMSTVADRVEIATGLKAGWSIRAIAAHIDRCASVVSREVRRNTTTTRGYKIVTADCREQRRRARPQPGKVAADPVLRSRVLADLGHDQPTETVRETGSGSDCIAALRGPPALRGPALVP